MNELVKSNSFLSSSGDAIDIEEVRMALAKLAAIKEALKAADEFRNKSIEFAQCEAYALIRAVELGGIDLIKGDVRKKTAQWLYDMDEYERLEFIAMCVDGKTIDNIYKEVVVKPQQKIALERSIRKCREEANVQLRKTGVVNVQSIVRANSDNLPRSMLHAVTDDVRDSVRRHGGVGIGDEMGTYIDPDVNSQYIDKALKTRISAVSRDIESIADLAQRCVCKPTFQINGNADSLTFMEVTYMILAGVNCARVKFDSVEARKKAKRIVKQIVDDAK